MKAEQPACRVVESDIEVSGIHQFADNSVYCSVELLQIFGRTGLFRDAIEGRAKRFRTLLLRYIAIKNINRDLLPADNDWRTRQEDIYQRAIFSLSLGLEFYFLSLIENFSQPLCFRIAIRGHDKRVNAASNGLIRKKAKQARKLAIDAPDSVLSIQNADSLGCALHQLIEIGFLHLGAIG